MEEFTYAHKNTQNGERATPTAQFNKPQISRQLQSIREGAFAREIPVSNDETLNFLQTLLLGLKPQNVLELGTAIGVSGAVMLQSCASSHLTTVERDEKFFTEAKSNFNALGLSQRVAQILGDAGEIIQTLPQNTFDFIFMDCAKVQYIKYLPVLKQLLKSGGTLAADDVLLFGYLTGEEQVPKKRKMLVQHVGEYIQAVTTDKELSTTVLNVGNGIALSVKK